MPGPLSSQMRVGRRLALTVFWTVILVVGVGLALLVGVTQLAELIQNAARWSTEARTGVVAVAVAMILSGVWGIGASHRNLRHSVDLITEVDRARTETLALETTRYAQRPK
jgi:chromate transport protein ChrA